MVRKRIYYCILFLSFFLLGTIIAFSSTTDARLILELDIEDGLPDFVGREFSFKFTCVSKEPTVHVTMYFDDLISQPVYDESADFFINQEVTISTVDADLLAGIEHTFTIRATDGVETKTINTQMTVDIIDPIFTYVSLTHVSVGGDREVISSSYVELHPDEKLILNWTANDEFMKGIKIYRNDLSDEIFYASQSSVSLTDAYFSITTPNVFEQTFDLALIAYDLAGNTAEVHWDVKMIKPETPYVPEEELDKVRQQEIEKRKMTQSGLLIGILLFGGLGGVVLGIVGANIGRSRVRGYIGGKASFVLKRQHQEDLSTWQWIRKYILSKFGLFVIAIISSLILWIFGGWVFLKYLTPRLFNFSTTEIENEITVGSGYFWQSFMSGFVWSFPFFCLITFLTAFITRKSKFDEIFVQLPPKKDGKIRCMVISVFTDRDGQTKVATSSFIDAVNGKYLPINYRDVERLRFELAIGEEVFTGIYIPSQEIKVEIDGVSVDVFSIHGAACIQELIDSKDSQDMATKFALISELQKLAEENTNLIRLLTKKIYSSGQEAAEEFKLFIESVASLTSSKILRDKVREEFERMMRDKKVPVFQQQQPPLPVQEAPQQQVVEGDNSNATS